MSEIRLPNLIKIYKKEICTIYRELYCINKMKKVYLMLILAVFLLAGCKKKVEQLQLEANAINENFDLDLYIYGQHIADKYNLEKTYVENISQVKTSAVYNILVINPEKNYIFSENEITVIKNLILKGVVLYFIEIESYSAQLINSDLKDYIKVEHKSGHYFVDYKNQKSFLSKNAKGIDAIIAGLTSYLKIMEGGK